MTLCVFLPSAEMRKYADMLASPRMSRHHAGMNTFTVHVDRSLRLAVSDQSGSQLAAMRLTRCSAEGLADALLEFCGNRIGGPDTRSCFRVDFPVDSDADRVTSPNLT